MGKKKKGFFEYRASLPSVVLVAGFIFGVLGYTIDTNEKTIAIFLKVADILLISGLLSFLTICAEYIGIFKNAVESVVMFDEKYLKKRKDIGKIWTSVTKVLFKSKFPAINGKLFDIIKDQYLSSENVSYYSNLSRTLKVKWHDKDKKLISVNDKTSLTLHTNNLDKAPYKATYSLIFSDKSKDDYDLDVSYIKVDGKIEKTTKDKRYQGNELISENTVILKGKKQYSIHQEANKIYSIEDDFYIGFKARYLLENLVVSIFLPEDIRVELVSRGTLDDFNCDDNDKSIHHFKYSYKGLMLKKQGYVLVLNYAE